MGQYYVAIILAEKVDGQKEFVRVWLSSYDYANGAKLTEHSYTKNEYMNAVEYALSENGPFYRSRLVWAGDYADNEAGSDENLHRRCQSKPSYQPMVPPNQPTNRYIVNHTLKEYVDKQGRYFHPLSLLTAEGNGRGGGDYSGSCEDLVGRWARHIISVEQEAPSDYTELAAEFGRGKN
jgi:hypothetical protein